MFPTLTLADLLGAVPYVTVILLIWKKDGIGSIKTDNVLFMAASIAFITIIANLAISIQAMRLAGWQHDSQMKHNFVFTCISLVFLLIMYMWYLWKSFGKSTSTYVTTNFPNLLGKSKAATG